MLNRIIEFLVYNKPATIFLAFLVVVLGIVVSPFDTGIDGMYSNPIAIDAIPNIGENQQIVYTEWKGQSPQDIEDQITYPLTSSLLGISGVKSVRSNSMFGFSSIYVIFDDKVDFYWSRSRILEKLNSLPKDILPAEVQPKLGPDATGLGQIFWYTLEGRDETGAVTGGWNLQELRSIQDFYVKNALASTKGVAEVASIGGFVKEYQIDLKPELLKQYGISLNQVVTAVKSSNRDIGAQTIEINRAEYFVRGLGYIKTISDIENTAVVSNNLSPIYIKDIANVNLGPAVRRGILDKGGAEVVGGVVTAGYEANPFEVSQQIKNQIVEISHGLPSKELKDGRISQLTIVPFYDRSVLIKESLLTLGDALLFEILITILIVILMLRNLKVSLLISGLMPLAVLVVFIAMKFFKVEANIVALSGIAIAIGTMVDMGIILLENFVRHQKESPQSSIEKTIIKSTQEVSGAILTAGLTTIVSFIPVFALTGAEGKLFAPLAFTKTVALSAAILITLFIIPPIAALVLKRRTYKNIGFISSILILVIGFLGAVLATYLGLILVIFGILGLLYFFKKIDKSVYRKLSFWISVLIIFSLLSFYWRPLGFEYNLLINGLFILLMTSLIMLPIYVLMRTYETILNWVLEHKKTSIVIPLVIVLLGFFAFLSMEKEFMPTLNEGDFLLMPTSLPQAGVEENTMVLKKLDMAVSSIPEVAFVVGKAGRVESALDPAPLSMYENLISYKPEFILDSNRKPLKFETDGDGKFKTRTGQFVSMGDTVTERDLVPSKNGEFYRNWRKHIQNEDDIWAEIIKVTKLPGVTSAPRLHPIETRLVMLQTGMRSAMGIKIRGQSLEDIEDFGLLLEQELKLVAGVAPESVFADRITGKPYVIIDIDRKQVARYGLSIEDIQQTLEVGVGGKVLAQTVEGRERYGIRVRYPRELRSSPEDLETIYVSIGNGVSLPLSQFVSIRYEKGPQSIKSEDGFLVGYVIFDKLANVSEISVVENAKRFIQDRIASNTIKVPVGVNFEFSGTYQNYVHSQKTLSLVIPLVLIVIFLILYVQFKSIKISFMVFFGVTVAFAGGFILMWFYGQSWFLNISLGDFNFQELFNIKTVHLSVAVWVGFIALFGISTDDGVIMATYLKQSFSEQKPNSIIAIREATLAAGRRRIRPCLMTTATTILALLPIITSTGKGSAIMLPMAIPCLGGMLMVVISLFVVPLLFCWEKEVYLKRSQDSSN
jgi:Cu(I)/Ag(I) efflux system membrane protein CusA/SilA